MGDTVNLAARVMSKAPPGHLYATRDVLHRAGERFAQTELEPFRVKGKARPVQAWDVGAPVRAATPSTGRPQLPLMGRDGELATLRAAIEQAARGSGSLIEIVGETGSGKSRLLSEARTIGAGMPPERVLDRVRAEIAETHWCLPAARLRSGRRPAAGGRWRCRAGCATRCW